MHGFYCRGAKNRIKSNSTARSCVKSSSFETKYEPILFHASLAMALSVFSVGAGSLMINYFSHYFSCA